MSLTPRWLRDDVMEADAREEKLPKYAQEKLRLLRMALQEQSALAEDALRRTNPEAAAILLDPYADHEGIGLADRSTVRFRPPEGGYLDINIRDGWVVVHGEHSLEIHPRVSNGITMRSSRP